MDIFAVLNLENILQSHKLNIFASQHSELFGMQVNSQDVKSHTLTYAMCLASFPQLIS